METPGSRASNQAAKIIELRNRAAHVREWALLALDATDASPTQQARLRELVARYKVFVLLSDADGSLTRTFGPRPAPVLSARTGLC